MGHLEDHLLNWIKLLNSPARPIIEESLKSCPSGHGAYVIFEDEIPIYVGTSNRPTGTLRSRMGQHLRGGGYDQFRAYLAWYRGIVPIGETSYRTNPDYIAKISDYVSSRCKFTGVGIEPGKAARKFEDLAKWAFNPEWNPWPIKNIHPDPDLLKP